LALEEEKCAACRADAPRATEEEITQWRGEVPDWMLIEEDGEEKLQRQFSFNNFREALDFTNRVGELAEEQNHHPALTTEYGKVNVVWWTHKIGGLHRNDFVCAAKTDLLYRQSS
jgi:4a-hydroxytetrahydrobiopterin dehydratase